MQITSNVAERKDSIVSINLIFLVIGLVLSVASKFMQFKYKEYENLGNLLVIPAAICFCLAVLFTLPKYKSLFESEVSRPQALLLAGLVCGAVVLFQIMMIQLVSNQAYLWLFLLIPIVVFTLSSAFIWFKA